MKTGRAPTNWTLYADASFSVMPWSSAACWTLSVRSAASRSWLGHHS